MLRLIAVVLGYGLLWALVAGYLLMALDRSASDSPRRDCDMTAGRAGMVCD